MKDRFNNPSHHEVALHQIKWLPGQSSRCTAVTFIRCECDEGCDWCILCDSGDLCRYFDIYLVYSVAFVVWWIITQWHLPLVDIWCVCVCVCVCVTWANRNCSQLGPAPFKGVFLDPHSDYVGLWLTDGTGFYQINTHASIGLQLHTYIHIHTYIQYVLHA